MQDTGQSSSAVVVFSKRMKRFLKLVAVIVVAGLTAQPALAGLMCQMVASASVPCAPRCPMAADCPMAHHGASADCLQDCCRYPQPQAIARSSRQAKPKADNASRLLAVPADSRTTHPAFAVPLPGDLAAASPPRTILLKVFRI
jgi:hypothetical protein